MGLETPNAGSIPYDVFIGRGWEPPGFRFKHKNSEGVDESDDLSDVVSIRLGMTRIGRPRVSYEITDADGYIELEFYPLNNDEPTGSEPPNAVQIRIPPAATDDWVEGLYAFDIALTRDDGSIDTVLEGRIKVSPQA